MSLSDDDVHLGKMKDTDVWFESKSHPGTKDFRRVIRYAVEDFDKDDEFTKTIYKSIMKELKGRRFFTGSEEVKEVPQEEVVERVAEAFIHERDRRIEKNISKSRKKREHNTKSPTNDNNKQEQKKIKRRNKQKKSRSKELTSNKTVQELETDMNIYIDDLEKTGTRALLTSVKRAVSKFPKAKWSQKIFKHIMKDIKSDRNVFWSLERRQELSREELINAIKNLFEKEKFMKGARQRDVYFFIHNHPGTKAWIRSVQQVVIKHGESEYTSFIYKEIEKRLYDSKFYVGFPPDCKEATKRERIEIFYYRYQDEKDKWIRIKRNKDARIRSKIKAKVSAGLVQPRYISEEDSRNENSEVRVRAVPGMLYWLIIKRMIADLPIFVKLNSYFVKMTPNWYLRMKLLFQEVSLYRQNDSNRTDRSNWLILLRIGMIILLEFAFFAIVMSIYYSILKALFLPW